MKVCIYRCEKVYTLIYFCAVCVTLIPPSNCVVCCQVLLAQRCVLGETAEDVDVASTQTLLTGRNVCLTQVTGSHRLQLLKHWPHLIAALIYALGDWVCFADTTSSRSVMATQILQICWGSTAVTSPRRPSSHQDPQSTSDLCPTMPTREPASRCAMRSTRRVRELYNIDKMGKWWLSG